jgi:hypothetical protein
VTVEQAVLQLLQLVVSVCRTVFGWDACACSVSRKMVLYGKLYAASWCHTVWFGNEWTGWYDIGKVKNWQLQRIVLQEAREAKHK